LMSEPKPVVIHGSRAPIEGARDRDRDFTDYKLRVTFL
jgi:hypothetical protein